MMPTNEVGMSANEVKSTRYISVKAWSGTRSFVVVV